MLIVIKRIEGTQLVEILQWYWPSTASPWLSGLAPLEVATNTRISIVRHLGNTQQKVSETLVDREETVTRTIEQTTIEDVDDDDDDDDEDDDDDDDDDNDDDDDDDGDHGS